ILIVGLHLKGSELSGDLIQGAQHRIVAPAKDVGFLRVIRRLAIPDSPHTFCHGRTRASSTQERFADDMLARHSVAAPERARPAPTHYLLDSSSATHTAAAPDMDWPRKVYTTANR